jgi:hypothetical protein
LRIEKLLDRWYISTTPHGTDLWHAIAFMQAGHGTEIAFSIRSKYGFPNFLIGGEEGELIPRQEWSAGHPVSIWALGPPSHQAHVVLLIRKNRGPDEVQGKVFACPVGDGEIISATQWRSPVGRQYLYKLVLRQMNPVAGKSKTYRHLTGL